MCMGSSSPSLLHFYLSLCVRVCVFHLGSCTITVLLHLIFLSLFTSPPLSLSHTHTHTNTHRHTHTHTQTHTLTDRLIINIPIYSPYSYRQWLTYQINIMILTST